MKREVNPSVIAIVVIVVLGLVGWFGYQKMKPAGEAPSTLSQGLTAATTPPSAPQPGAAAPMPGPVTGQTPGLPTQGDTSLTGPPGSPGGPPALDK